MSYKDFEEAITLAPSCEYYTISEGLTLEKIQKAEDMLDIQFSPQLLEFYKRFNYMSFSGNEFFGIDPESTSGELEGNSVAYTLDMRSRYAFPKEWIPFYNYGDGSLVCLDYSTLNLSKEPPVICCDYDGKQYQIVEHVAEDFGAFLLSMVKGALEED